MPRIINTDAPSSRDNFLHATYSTNRRSRCFVKVRYVLRLGHGVSPISLNLRTGYLSSVTKRHRINRKPCTRVERKFPSVRSDPLRVPKVRA